jgi:tetrahydromethanopterin S-methyltransferase subunit H
MVIDGFPRVFPAWSGPRQFRDRDQEVSQSSDAKQQSVPLVVTPDFALYSA